MEPRRINWRLLVHSLGLGCLSSSVFLQILVFKDIVQQGYFMAVEKNQVILTFEVLLTLFAVIYFGYIYLRFVRSVR